MNRATSMAVCASLLLATILSACQSTGAGRAGALSPDDGYEVGPATAQAEAELEAEADALALSRSAVGTVAGLDPTGLSAIPVMVGTLAAEKAFAEKSRARLKAAEEADLQVFYKKYGMNPDGTPSGKPPGAQ